MVRNEQIRILSKTWLVKLLLLLQIIILEGGYSQVIVSIPDTTGKQDSTVLIPVKVDLKNYGVISYQFEVTFDANVLTPEGNGATATGTLTGNWSGPYVNKNIDGKLIVGSFYSPTDTVRGTGNLVNLIFTIQGNVGDSTNLNFSFFIFNNGYPDSYKQSGKFTVVELNQGFALPISNLLITHDGVHDVRLSWSASTNATYYNIYRGTTPFFAPLTPIVNTTNLSFVDPDVTGDPNINYYYVVTAVNHLGESAISKRVGEFDFELITTPKTDFNEIALPLIISGINKASQLMTAIPNCNSVARWDASFQGYEQYVPLVPPTDFDVYPGYPCYVNVTAKSTFTLTGAYAEPVFNLITTSKTDFNEIMLPLDRGEITTAAQLLSAIPNCNSVARWNASFQGYEQYVPLIPPTNFNVYLGYPYYVNITSNTTWPAGLIKNMFEENQRTCSYPAMGLPHLVYGKIYLSPNIDFLQLHFKAFIITREDDQLSEQSPGSSLSSDGLFWVQCGYFITPWQAGDEIRLEFYLDKKNAALQIFSAILINDPVDELLLIADEISSIDESNRGQVTEFDIKQNYPNPFNAETMICLTLPAASYMQLIIYNQLGQQIRTLVDGDLTAGSHRVVWDAKRNDMTDVSSGIYFYKLTLSDMQIIKKMILMR